MTKRLARLLIIATVLVSGICFAQFSWRERPSRGDGNGRVVRIEGGAWVDEDTVRTARETISHSMDTPNWTNAPGFERDVFTFARVIFQSDPSGSRRGFGRRLGWWVDYPDADLNLSFRLQQITSIPTDPDARVFKLTDPALFEHPLIYIEHAGYMRLSDEEISALRRYFHSGGAMFVNDFWSTPEWEGFAGEIARVLPGRSWVDLDAEHPIFHCVFNLQGPMHRLRVPTIQFWDPAHDPNDASSPLHRVYRGEGSDEMHVRALLDDAGRIMIVAIHNSDVSDGWERENEDDVYFNRYSEKIAYPLGINIVFYLMTH